MGRKKWVSYNQPIDEAKYEEELLIKKGYVVVDSYGHDFDMGTVWEDATGNDKKDVLKRHDEYVKYLKNKEDIK